jgi:peptide/nickel transport system permease protein
VTLRDALEGDLAYAFRKSPAAIASAALTILLTALALFAPLLAPQNAFDPASFDLANSFLPPAWSGEGDARFWLGTDDQGRDMLSALLYGARISLLVGFLAVGFAAMLGIAIGLAAGMIGGWFDAAAMRLADVQLTIPALLTALMIDGVIRASVDPATHAALGLWVMVFAIGIAEWPQFARVTRAGAIAERNKSYVEAARLLGVPRATIALRHVLPNALPPIIVVATLSLGLAILAEATLSFLGVGLPPTTPSLGTLIRIGQEFLFSGEWWIVLFPALALVILVLSINLLGDWLRDALDPKLR